MVGDHWSWNTFGSVVVFQKTYSWFRISVQVKCNFIYGHFVRFLLAVTKSNYIWKCWIWELETLCACLCLNSCKNENINVPTNAPRVICTKLSVTDVAETLSQSLPRGWNIEPNTSTGTKFSNHTAQILSRLLGWCNLWSALNHSSPCSLVYHHPFGSFVFVSVH